MARGQNAFRGPPNASDTGWCFKTFHRVVTTMTLDTVLVAVGEQSEGQAEQLASITEEVAGPAGASVVLGHVFTEDEYGNTLDRLDMNPDDTSPDEVADRNVTVRELRDRFEAAGIDVAHRGGVGERAPGVVGFAEETDADLLVVGGRRRSPTGKAVFGSTAQEILLDAPCPVTLVKREE